MIHVRPSSLKPRVFRASRDHSFPFLCPRIAILLEQRFKLGFRGRIRIYRHGRRIVIVRSLFAAKKIAQFPTRTRVLKADQRIVCPGSWPKKITKVCIFFIYGRIGSIVRARNSFTRSILTAKATTVQAFKALWAVIVPRNRSRQRVKGRTAIPTFQLRHGRLYIE
jgi:hypothetical protein